MSIEKRYNIETETVKKMVKDGVISCSVARHHEIYDYYCQYKAAHPNMKVWDLYGEVAEQLHLSLDTVRGIVYKLGRK